MVEQPERVYTEEMTFSSPPFMASKVLLCEQEWILLKKAMPAHNAVHLTPPTMPDTAVWPVHSPQPLDGFSSNLPGSSGSSHDIAETNTATF